MKGVTALFCAAAILLLSGLAARAAVPPPEKLLPEDTLVLVTAPDYAKLREAFLRLPQTQCWNDPAMKPFREKFAAKWNENLVKPLERELGIHWDDYTNLWQGQLTLAVTRSGWPSPERPSPGLLLLLDSKDKTELLKTNLAGLRQKWVESGKTLRAEKVRGFDFTVLSLSSNDVPPTLRKLFPKRPEVQELGDDAEQKTPAPKSEIAIGQIESLLVLANSTKAVESVAARLTGGGPPPLAESALYQPNHLALFREAPLYAWVNVKALLDIMLGQAAGKKDNPEAPNPFDLKPEKIMAALGLTGLKTASFALQESNEGTLLQTFLAVPESSRFGIFKILAGVAKEVAPPPFVPADAVKFQRWRIDGQKSWAALEKTIQDISPQWMGGINFILETANAAGRTKDPGFDVRKSLLGNLGDDLIRYEKAPQNGAGAGAQSGPALLLLGSPNPEQMAGALRSIFGFVSQQAGTPPEEREFLGRKIYSVPLRSMALPFTGAPGAAVPRNLSYAASGGYVAFSTDVSLLEEYLRSSDSQTKALKDNSGLPEAAQRVTGPGCSLFGYKNQAETTKAVFAALKKDAGAATNSNALAAANLLPGALGFSTAGLNPAAWFDFSSLPAFDQVSKYFYFTVYGGSATVDGLTLKVFAPLPPGLRGGGVNGK